MGAHDLGIRFFQPQLTQADDACHGCTYFVAHIGQELGFGTAGVVGSPTGHFESMLGLLALSDVVDVPMPKHCTIVEPLRLRLAVQPAFATCR